MRSLRPSGCPEGDDALARGAWDQARDAFETALRQHETADALEGLGLAAWWLDLSDVVFDARERAYRLYLASDRPVDAARIAVWLAWDCWAFRGEGAVGNGWLQRARRLLEAREDCAERSWLESRAGALALLDDGDPERARAHAADGVRAAKAVGSVDFEMLNRAVAGLAAVASGDVTQGMRALDEVNAAVLSGELTDLVAIGLSCCYMISACERVRDTTAPSSGARASRSSAHGGGCVRSSPSAARSTRRSACGAGRGSRQRRSWSPPPRNSPRHDPR
ncbi:MAG: hypothetical protein U0P82_12895 [Vicinamibacterales bacterium]